ncbi:MAG: methyltransferase domain-containing protein [Anaerolineae bacterium]|nr:methyltransferase domain-containing protein [Anaerolineae bacterium]
MKINISFQSKNEIIQKYNEIYKKKGNLRDVDALYRWVLDLLAPSPGQALLDVGCGEGILVRYATERGLIAWGIDISWEAAQLARAGSQRRILISEGESLPFKSESFDYVTNLGSLEHFFDPLQGVYEMKRILKLSGVAAILLPNSYYIGDIIWHVWRTGYGPRHKQPLERFATFGEWRDLLEKGGLQITQVFKYNFMFPRTPEDWRWYFRHPRKFLYLLLAPFIPFNLSYSFLFLCKKSI